MNSSFLQCDIVIIGGGLVGLTLAGLLAKQTSLTVAVIENHQPELQWSNQFDVRVSAINRASERIWRFIDIWDVIEKQGVSSYQHMQVWDQVSGGKIAFNSNDVTQTNLGYIIEHRIAIKALYQHIATLQSIQLFCPAQPIAFSVHPDYVLIELDKVKIQAQLLIGADGAHSWVRNQLNISAQEQPYQQDALVTTVRTEKSHQQTAWQCFLADGPIALLPFQDPHYCSMVWSASPDHAQTLQNMSSQQFDSALTDIFAEQLGRCEKADQLIKFPLTKRHVKHYVQPRLALAGDCAHTIHPLAGQGVNLGLLDAACLSEVIAKAKQQQRSIYTLETLRRYERWRKSDNWDMIAAMDIFKQLFTTSNTLLQPLRRFSLNTVHKAGFIKRFFIRRALGLQGDLPKICHEK